MPRWNHVLPDRDCLHHGAPWFLVRKDSRVESMKRDMLHRDHWVPPKLMRVRVAREKLDVVAKSREFRHDGGGRWVRGAWTDVIMALTDVPLSAPLPVPPHDVPLCGTPVVDYLGIGPEGVLRSDGNWS